MNDRLKHEFAKAAVLRGESMRTIAGMLGHSMAFIGKAADRPLDPPEASADDPTIIDPSSESKGGVS